MPAPYSPSSPLPAQLQAPREQQQEGTASASLRAGQESEERNLAGEDKKGEGDIEQELSQWEGEEVTSYHELSNWEEYLKQELPQNI